MNVVPSRVRVDTAFLVGRFASCDCREHVPEDRCDASTCDGGSLDAGVDPDTGSDA